MSKILLLLDHRENRRLLAEALSPHYEIILPDSDEALSEAFGLGILDGVALDRLWERVHTRKQREQPAFLPFLLVTSRQDVGLATRHLWKSVDELIISPIEKVELQARVNNLLHTRRLSLEQYRVMVQAAPLAILVLDRAGKVQQWNPAAERIFGWSESEVLGRPLPAVPEGEQDEFGRLHGKVLRGERFTGIEVRRQQKDGSSVDVAVSAAPLRDVSGMVTGVVYVVADITERKRAEEALRRSRDELRSLTARLGEVEEAERRRLSRELHDRVGQLLTALGINLSVARRALASGAAAQAAGRLEAAAGLLGEAMERARDVMADLWLPVLDDYGLGAALRWHASRFGPQAGLTLAVEGEDPSPRLAPAVETALFRIAQEALTNVAKHARASRVTISLEEAAGGVRLTVADDGVGFNPQAPRRPGEVQGWGLPSMRERAEAVGGTLCVESAPGRGTRVVVEVAMRNDAPR